MKRIVVSILAFVAFACAARLAIAQQQPLIPVPIVHQPAYGPVNDTFNSNIADAQAILSDPVASQSQAAVAAAQHIIAMSQDGLSYVASPPYIAPQSLDPRSALDAIDTTANQNVSPPAQSYMAWYLLNDGRGAIQTIKMACSVDPISGVTQLPQGGNMLIGALGQMQPYTTSEQATANLILSAWAQIDAIFTNIGNGQSMWGAYQTLIQPRMGGH